MGGIISQPKEVYSLQLSTESKKPTLKEISRGHGLNKDFTDLNNKKIFPIDGSVEPHSLSRRSFENNNVSNTRSMDRDRRRSLDDKDKIKRSSNIEHPKFQESRNLRPVLEESMKRPSLENDKFIRRSLDSDKSQRSIENGRTLQRPSLDIDKSILRPSLDRTNRRPSVDNERINQRTSFDNDKINQRPSFDNDRTLRRQSLDNPEHDRTNRRISLDNDKTNRRPSLDNDKVIRSSESDSKNFKTPAYDLSISGLKRTLPKKTVVDMSPLHDLELGIIIGKGLMGTIQLAKWKPKNIYVAIKSIRKDDIYRFHDERHVKNEKEVLLTLSSSFCVKLFRTLQDDTNIYFMMEYVPGGELFRRLETVGKFQPQTAKFYALEIFSALEHLHSCGFVHRDLKPENVMIDQEGHIKLIDFGFTTSGSRQMQTQCGTPAYLSPEQLNAKFTGGYTDIVDWWSFGVLLFELLTGYTPFCKNPRDSSFEIYTRIINAKKIQFPHGFDQSSQQLISQLCEKNIKQRLCVPLTIRLHPYFTFLDGHLHWQEVEDRKLIPPYVPALNGEGDVSHFNLGTEACRRKYAIFTRPELPPAKEIDLEFF